MDIAAARSKAVDAMPIIKFGVYALTIFALPLHLAQSRLDNSCIINNVHPIVPRKFFSAVKILI